MTEPSTEPSKGFNRRVWCVIGVCVWSVLWWCGCEPKPFDEPQRLGGELIAAETLNRGYVLYTEHCAGCHGEEGRGDGPRVAAAGRDRLSPRNLTRGIFKYTSTLGDALPRDEDLMRTLEQGLAGTEMKSFADVLSTSERASVVAYLKTLSPRWREETPGEGVMVGEDPWEGRGREGVERGRRLYHGDGGCWRCHAAYVSEAMIEAWSGGGELEGRGDVSRAREVSTLFGPALPPDLESATFRSGSDAVDLYRVISVGVGGVTGDEQAAALSEQDRWALVRYVRSLRR